MAGSGIVNRSAVEGSDFSLTCSLSSNPSANLEFNFASQDDALPDNALPNNVMFDESQQLVTVEGAVTDNEGRYICNATNTVAVTLLIYNVIIGGKVHIGMSTHIWLVASGMNRRTQSLSAVIFEDLPVLLFEI